MLKITTLRLRPFSFLLRHHVYTHLVKHLQCPRFIIVALTHSTHSDFCLQTVNINKKAVSLPAFNSVSHCCFKQSTNMSTLAQTPINTHTECMQKAELPNSSLSKHDNESDYMWASLNNTATDNRC